jgi:hypothetical protein
MTLLPPGLRKLFRPMPLPDTREAEALGAALRAAKDRAVAATVVAQDRYAAAIDEVLEKVNPKGRPGAR